MGQPNPTRFGPMKVIRFGPIKAIRLNLSVHIFQVAPAELEALLLSHSEILDAAVIP